MTTRTPEKFSGLPERVWPLRSNPAATRAIAAKSSASTRWIVSASVPQRSRPRKRGHGSPAATPAQSSNEAAFLRWRAMLSAIFTGVARRSRPERPPGPRRAGESHRLRPAPDRAGRRPFHRSGRRRERPVLPP